MHKVTLTQRESASVAKAIGKRVVACDCLGPVSRNRLLGRLQVAVCEVHRRGAMEWCRHRPERLQAVQDGT